MNQGEYTFISDLRGDSNEYGDRCSKRCSVYCLDYVRGDKTRRSGKKAAQRGRADLQREARKMNNLITIVATFGNERGA